MTATQICPLGAEATVAPRTSATFNYLYNYTADSADLDKFLLQSYYKYANDR